MLLSLKWKNAVLNWKKSRVFAKKKHVTAWKKNALGAQQTRKLYSFHEIGKLTDLQQSNLKNSQTLM